MPPYRNESLGNEPLPPLDSERASWSVSAAAEKRRGLSRKDKGEGLLPACLPCFRPGFTSLQDQRENLPPPGLIQQVLLGLPTRQQRPSTAGSSLGSALPEPPVACEGKCSFRGLPETGTSHQGGGRGGEGGGEFGPLLTPPNTVPPPTGQLVAYRSQQPPPAPLSTGYLNGQHSRPIALVFCHCEPWLCSASGEESSLPPLEALARPSLGGGVCVCVTI